MLMFPDKNKKMIPTVDIASKPSTKIMSFFLDHLSTRTPANGITAIVDPKPKKPAKPKNKAELVSTVIQKIIVKLAIDEPNKEINCPIKNIRKLLEIIEQSIVQTLKYYNIESKADRKNIGIWYQNKNELEKVAAIGIKVKKWIAISPKNK